MNKSSLSYIELLEPISAEFPCGQNLEYDHAFIMLQSAAAPQVEAQYGDFVGTPEPLNWADIERDCKSLLMRTRDIRLIIIFIRCRIRQTGAQGLLDGLNTLDALLDKYPEQIHPQAYSDEEYDPIIRANSIAELSDQDAILIDIRDITLSKVSGLELQLRDIEKALAVPRISGALAPELVKRILKELKSNNDKTILCLIESSKIARNINNKNISTLQEYAPDLGGLLKLLEPFGELNSTNKVNIVVNDTQENHTDAIVEHGIKSDINTTQKELNQAIVPTIKTRMDARLSIEIIRHWFEENEPSSPISALLAQAENMVGKRFLDIVNVIPVELMKQWESNQ